MKLTDEQHKKLTQYVATRWKAPFQCPYCKSNSWDITREIFQLTEFSKSGLVLGGPVVPLAPVTCTSCGHTVLLNAIIAGVLEPDAQEAKKDGI